MVSELNTRACLVLVCATAALLGTALAGAAQPAARCRRVQLTGTVTVRPAPAPGFTGHVLAAEGSFKMDLIFPTSGGDVRFQESTVTLSKIVSYPYGGARVCTVALPAEAKTPRRFTAWATLGPDAVVVEDGAQKGRAVLDQFDVLVKQAPAFPAVTYTSRCEGGRPGEASDGGVSHAQLVRVFAASQYSSSVKLNRLGDRRRLPEVDLFGRLTGKAEFEILETLVPCANFEYR
jgi:hypothetical protein